MSQIIDSIKKCVITCNLFDNSYPLLIKYILNKIGFNVKLEARIGPCAFELDPKDFERLVSRLSSFFLTRSIKCINGKLFINEVEVNDVGDLIYNYEAFAKVLGWRYNSESDCWIKDGIKFRHMYWSIFEVFDQGEYNALNANGKTVVDVGAYVGDSSIYFALRGAKRVIAIEPHPTAFKEMLDNIRLNNLEYVIVPINAGLASKQGKICIGETDVSRTAGLYYRSDKYGGEIPAITLSELIKKYGVGYDAVLKMDCEGCEYDIILNDYQSVKIFNELIFEYHTDTTSEPVSRLLKVLARDYCYKIVKRRKGFGIVHCVRR